MLALLIMVIGIKIGKPSANNGSVLVKTEGKKLITLNAGWSPR